MQMHSTIAASAAVSAALAGSPTQCWKDGKTAPCGPGNDQCGPPTPDYLRPNFHIKDISCGENDPNFPFYDEVHGVYHLMYQDHLCIDGGHGPDIGHVVSRDFVHWAHLPVSIWNDQWYDNQAIFTGSATVVDGKPYIVYPGLCDKAHPGCVTYADYAIAVPSNASDPLYRNWSKPDYNPIINGTSDDPSTAWRTEHGEWRLIGNSPAVGQKDKGVAPLFAAKDFEGPWHLVGDQCPSFFPLPPLHPGSTGGNATAGAAAGTPTHVHKRGHGSAGCAGDCMQLGTYTDGAPGQVGTWEATPGIPFTETLIDHGAYYASKDFWDPVQKRRINWGWATISGGAQSMARSLTYHAALRQLVHAPAAEYAKLRAPGPPLADLGPTPVPAYAPVPLDGGGGKGGKDGKKWAAGAGNSSEIAVVFKRPSAACTLGVSILSRGAHVFVDYQPPALADAAAASTTAASSAASTVRVGIASGPPPARPPPPPGTVGNGTCGATSYGGDCDADPTGAWQPASQSPPVTTLAECAAKAQGCKMAKYVSFSDVPGNQDCSWYSDCDFDHLCEDCSKCGIGCPKYYPYQSEVLKKPAPASQMEATRAVAGLVGSDADSGVRSGADFTDNLQLLPTDTEITLRIFVDRTVIEAYWQGGRVAMTAAAPREKPAASVPQAEVFATAAAQLASAQAHAMGSIWVTPEEVLATPRRDDAGA